jgi:hypothetical protein
MTFINDTLTDTVGTTLTAHTGEQGATWTQAGFDAGEAVFDGANRVYFRNVAPSEAGGLVASGLPAGPDYDVAWGLYNYTNIASSIAAVGRFDPATGDGYLAGFSTVSGWLLWRMDAGVRTVIDSSAATLATSTEYDLVMTFRGSTIALEVEGVEVCSVTDATYSAAGRVGIYSPGVQTVATGRGITYINATDYVSDDPVVDAGADDSVLVNTAWVGGGSFTDADSSSWTATVDYDDGAGAVELILDGTDFDLAHTWTSTGTKTVTVEVDDGEGGVGTDTVSVVVIEGASTGSYISTGVTGSDLTAPFIAIISG